MDSEERYILCQLIRSMPPWHIESKWNRCDCGVLLTGEDAVFWGECETCRNPANTRSNVVGKFTGQDKSDWEYHGGRFYSAEW